MPDLSKTATIRRMAGHDLQWLSEEVARLSAVINAPATYAPIFGSSQDGGFPNVEFDGSQFHYWIIDRGIECEHFVTSDEDEILYRIFTDITWSLAGDHVRGKYDPDTDIRLAYFPAQEQLMGRLSPVWYDRMAAQHRQTLIDHPFRSILAPPPVLNRFGQPMSGLQLVLQSSAWVFLVVIFTNLFFVLWAAALRQEWKKALVIFIVSPFVNILIMTVSLMSRDPVRRRSRGHSITIYVATSIAAPLLGIVVDWASIFL